MGVFDQHHPFGHVLWNPTFGLPVFKVQWALPLKIRTADTPSVCPGTYIMGNTGNGILKKLGFELFHSSICS